MIINTVKLIRVVICLCLLGFCLSGCSGSDSAATSEITDQSLENETSDASENEDADIEVATIDGTDEDTAIGSTWELAVESKIDFPIFTVDFSDKEHGVTVGQAGKIFYTNDGGKNWTKAANDSACRFGLDIINGNVVYTCGNQSEITKSTDGGVTFEKVEKYGESEPKQCTHMSFCDENTGIAASKEKLGITTDGANSWTDLQVPCSIMAIRMVSASEFYLLSEDMVLYKTVDSGKTWEDTKINLPLGDDYYFDLNNIDFSVQGDQAYTIFIIQNSEKRLKSYTTTDNGATFIENQMPDTKMPVVPRLAVVKLNQKGNMITILNLGNSTIYSYILKEE